MRYIIFLAALYGCASLPGIIRITAEVGKLICAAEGCPCAGAALRPGSPAFFDIYPDGGMRPVYR